MYNVGPTSSSNIKCYTKVCVYWVRLQSDYARCRAYEPIFYRVDNNFATRAAALQTQGHYSRRTVAVEPLCACVISTANIEILTANYLRPPHPSYFGMPRPAHPVILKHTTTLFSLSLHDFLSQEWRVIVDQVRTNYYGRPNSTIISQVRPSC